MGENPSRVVLIQNLPIINQSTETMNLTENIDYCIAQSFFDQAEKNGQKLILGNLNTNIWLHNEKINLDFVIETSKRFTDSRIFIISEGIHKGFYIYSKLKMNCFKLISTSNKIQYTQAV